LAVTALVEAGILFERPDFTAAALRTAELLATLHTTPDGVLLRTSRAGRASRNAGVLEDYGCVAEAYLAVLGVTGQPVWLDRARMLLDRSLADFRDPAGGFFDTSSAAEELVLRPKDLSDNASPSGTSALVHAFIAAAAVTGESAYRAAADAGLLTAAPIARQAPRFAGWTLAAAEALQSGPLEIAIVGPVGERDELHRAAVRHAPGGSVVIAGDVGTAVPLFEQRGLVDGLPTAYVCQHFVCQRPVTTEAALAELLG
jgi:uncharacterized protein YyaL (SSP411 family)